MESSKTIGVYIDNNVWDFLLSEGLELAAELPVSEFNVFITREEKLKSSICRLKSKSSWRERLLTMGSKQMRFWVLQSGLEPV